MSATHPVFVLSKEPILWPVKWFQPQEDGPEVEVGLMFRFKRPMATDRKAYLEQKKARAEQEARDLEERFAEPLRQMTQAQRDAIDPSLLSPGMLKAANTPAPDKKLTDAERAARLDALFDINAWRNAWWLGWKAGAIAAPDDQPLDPDKPEHRAYLLEGIAPLEEAINRTLDEIMLGGRQKNLLPPLAS